MSPVQSASRPVPLRPERGIVSVIDGGNSEALTASAHGRVDLLPALDLTEPITLTPRNYQTALSLLECAAKALEILYDRRDELEASLDDLSMRAEGAIVAVQAKVLDWQRLAGDLRQEVQELERRLGTTQQRAEAAETQLEAERARADIAERRATDALGLSQGLHSKIMTAFGRGSNAHKALLVAVDETPSE